MFCPKCGADLGEGARFCRQCGAQISATPTRASQGPTGPGNVTGPGGRFRQNPGVGGPVAAGSLSLRALARIVAGVLALVDAFMFYSTLGDTWDDFEIYLDLVDGGAVGIPLAIVFPVLLLFFGIRLLITAFVDATGSGSFRLKPAQLQANALANDGVALFVLAVIPKVFAAFYKFDWSNSVAIHTVWWVVDMYEGPINFMLAISVIFIVAGFLLASTEGTLNRRR